MIETEDSFLDNADRQPGDGFFVEHFEVIVFSQNGQRSDPNILQQAGYESFIAPETGSLRNQFSRHGRGQRSAQQSFEVESFSLRSTESLGQDERQRDVFH